MAYTVTNNPWSSQYTIGVGTDTPVAFGAGSVGVQVGAQLSLQNVVGVQASYQTNIYYDGTVWKSITNTSANASAIRLQNGYIDFHTAPVSTSGQTMSNWDTTDKKMSILPSGNIGIGTATPSGKLQVHNSSTQYAIYSTDGNLELYAAESTPGYVRLGSAYSLPGLYGGSGLNYIVETGYSHVFRRGSTAIMTVSSSGAMQMSRIASDITFADNVGGMYVRQNGNGAGNEEELRIFGRNISLISHTGTRYMNITSTGNLLMNTTVDVNPDTSSKVIKLGDRNIWQNTVGNQLCLSRNAYYTTGSSWSNIVTGGATAIRMNDDPGDASIVFFTTGSATAGTVLTNWDANGPKMVIRNGGGVGIGTTNPGTYKLNVAGTLYSAGSSLEYKTEITTLDIDTEKLMELRPVTYQYKDEYKHLGKQLKSGTQIGLIAEEVAEVFPELAMMKEDEDGETRVRNVDYEKLSILLLKEVQKLRKEVNELKER